MQCSRRGKKVKPEHECIAVTGATSFIGRHLIKKLSERTDVDLRLLAYSNTVPYPTNEWNIKAFKGDLLQPESLEGFLRPGCTVVNLVNLKSASERDNLTAMTNLAVICRNARIKRLIQCSTAVVVGNVPDDNITEETLCHPARGYETIKYKVESLCKELSAGHFELAFLRPTAVFGAGGKNLMKLVEDLNHEKRFINYLRSCLFNHRRMNLVFIDNVVAALIFLADSNRKLDGDVFLISDDDDPKNNYRDVEEILMRRLGHRDYAIPRLPLPGSVLAFLLKLAEKSNVNPDRVYIARKIQNAGYRKVCSFEAGLEAFVNSYKQGGH